MYSIIIPSLGRINYLNQLLQSIYSQTLLPEEILILLDKNESCNDVAKFIYKKNNCYVVFCKNLNLSQKRNYGAENIWAIDKTLNYRIDNWIIKNI